MDRRDRPPVILLGGESLIGLTVVRELGERGVPVHVVARSRDALALYSRWAASRHLRERGETQMVDLLNRIAESHGARYVMAIIDADLLSARKAADENRLPKLKVLMPPIPLLHLVRDKLATYNAAHEVGIPVPPSWEPQDRYGWEDIPEDITYPCVLKWRDPFAIYGRLRSAGIPWLKAEYCYNRKELATALSRYRPIGQYPVVQAYCPGVGLGHMIFMHKGESLLSFQHIRRAEWPPGGGVSTVCSSLSTSFHSDWIAKSEALLRKIGWEGPAMVEYRYDDRTDSRMLMEINGRFWGSLALAYHAGAHFAWLTYAVLGVGENPGKISYREGITCRHMVPEVRRVYQVLFRREAIANKSLEVSRSRTVWSFIVGFFSPRMRYYVFSLRDPWPFICDLRFMVQRVLLKCFDAKRPRG